MKEVDPTADGGEGKRGAIPNFAAAPIRKLDRRMRPARNVTSTHSPVQRRVALEPILVAFLGGRIHGKEYTLVPG